MKVDLGKAQFRPVRIERGGGAAVSFGDVLSGTVKKISSDGRALSERLESVSRELSGPNSERLIELLKLQFRIGQYGLGLELLSKVGESANSSIRRLEQGH
ncbi:MAG: hypothetical protein K1X83_01800 [Oligoflexia bacterium]|nr:hypothetical protein [Oligoflexia bacterium]